MNCPNCDSENPNDKKYCGECGSRLGRSLDSLKSYVDSAVQRGIREQFRDQTVVEIELSQAVVGGCVPSPVEIT